MVTLEQDRMRQAIERVKQQRAPQPAPTATPTPAPDPASLRMQAAIQQVRANRPTPVENAVSTVRDTAGALAEGPGRTIRDSVGAYMEMSRDASDRGMDLIKQIPVAGPLFARKVNADQSFTREALAGAGDAVAGLSNLADMVPGSQYTAQRFVGPGTQRLARGFSSAVRENLAADPDYQDSFLSEKVPAALGSTVPIIGATAAGGPVAAVATGVGMGSEGAGRDAQENNATDRQEAIARLGGGAIGATEALPILGAAGRFGGKVIGPIQRRAQNALGRRGAGVLAQSAEEGVQEAGATLGQNVLARNVAGYDPERQYSAGVGEAAILGATVGGMLGAGANVGPELPPRPQPDPFPSEQPPPLFRDAAEEGMAEQIRMAERAQQRERWGEIDNPDLPVFNPAVDADAQLRKELPQISDDPQFTLNSAERRLSELEARMKNRDLPAFDPALDADVRLRRELPQISTDPNTDLARAERRLSELESRLAGRDLPVFDPQVESESRLRRELPQVPSDPNLLLNDAERRLGSVEQRALDARRNRMTTEELLTEAEQRTQRLVPQRQILPESGPPPLAPVDTPIAPEARQQAPAATPEQIQRPVEQPVAATAQSAATSPQIVSNEQSPVETAQGGPVVAEESSNVSETTVQAGQAPVAAPQTTVGETQKKPWEMTREEFQGAVSGQIHSDAISAATSDAQVPEILSLEQQKFRLRKFMREQFPETKSRSYETSWDEDWTNAHKATVQQAATEGQPVPREVLQDYAGEPWADAALAASSDQSVDANEMVQQSPPQIGAGQAEAGVSPAPASAPLSEVDTPQAAPLSEVDAGQNDAESVRADYQKALSEMRALKPQPVTMFEKGDLFQSNGKAFRVTKKLKTKIVAEIIAGDGKPGGTVEFRTGGKGRAHLGVNRAIPVTEDQLNAAIRMAELREQESSTPQPTQQPAESTQALAPEPTAARATKARLSDLYDRAVSQQNLDIRDAITDARTGKSTPSPEVMDRWETRLSEQAAEQAEAAAQKKAQQQEKFSKLRSNFGRPSRGQSGAVNTEALESAINAALAAKNWTVETTQSAAEWLSSKIDAAKATIAQARRALIDRFGAPVRRFVGRVFEAMRSMTRSQFGSPGRRMRGAVSVPKPNLFRGRPFPNADLARQDAQRKGVANPEIVSVRNGFGWTAPAAAQAKPTAEPKAEPKAEASQPQPEVLNNVKGMKNATPDETAPTIQEGGKGIGEAVRTSEIARRFERPLKVLAEGKAGADAVNRVLKMETNRRMMVGESIRELEVADTKLRMSDRRWLKNEGKAVYESGGKAPNKRIQNYFDMWRKVADRYGEKAEDLGVMIFDDRVKPIIKFDALAAILDVNPSDLKTPQGNFSASKLADILAVDASSLRDSDGVSISKVVSAINRIKDGGSPIRQADIYSPGGKRPFKRSIPNYVPRILTPEARLALQEQRGPLYDAMVEEANRRGIDPIGLAEASNIVHTARRYGSLESPRIGEMPDTVNVNGRQVPILETNLPKIVEGYIERASRRLALIEEFGQESAQKEAEDIQRAILKEQGSESAETWSNVWAEVQARGQGDPLTDYLGTVGEYISGLEQLARAAQLSQSAIANIGGIAPIAVRHGTVNLMKGVAVDILGTAGRVGRIPNRFTEQLEDARRLDGWRRDVMAHHYAVEDFKGIAGNISSRALKAVMYNAINRHIQKIASVSAKYALDDAISYLNNPKDGRLRKMWGRSPEGMRDMLRTEFDFADAQIDGMMKNGIDRTRLAQAIQRSVTKINVYSESPLDRPPWMSNQLARRFLAYMSYVRSQGNQLSDSISQAKRGNWRPLITTMLVYAPFGVAMNALRAFLRKKEDEDEAFWEKLAAGYMEMATFGLMGAAAEDMYYMYKFRNYNLTNIPQFEFLLKTFAGMGEAVYKAATDSPGAGGMHAYKTLVRNVPIFRTMDAQAEGPLYRDSTGGGGIEASDSSDGSPLRQSYTRGSYTRGSTTRGSYARGGADR